MSKRTFFVKIAGLLFLSLMLWGIFILGRTILERSNNSNADFIPENSTFVARINGKKFLKTGLSHVFLKSQDNEIIELFDEMIERRKGRKTGKESKKRMNVGVDLVSDIYLFSIDYQGNPILGILFNLSNPKKFDERIAPHLNELQGYASKGDVGLILNLTVVNSSKSPSQKELNKIASDLLNTESHFDLEKLEKQNTGNIVAQSWSKKGHAIRFDFLTESSVDFNVDEHNLLFNGHLEGVQFPKRPFKEISPESFHLHATALSHKMGDSLSKLLKTYSVDIPEISAISMNYRSSTMIEHPSLLVVPDADFLFRTVKPFSIDSLISDFVEYGWIEKTAKGRFEVNKMECHYRQVDATTFYIGKRPLSYAKEQKDYVVRISGPLKGLTTIKGNGFMHSFLSAIPIYMASNRLAKSVESTDLTIQKPVDDQAQITGNIMFKDSAYPLNEIVKFLLKSGMVR